MSYARPPKEDAFVNAYLHKEIHALGVDSGLQEKFLNFAEVEGGADRRKFRARLYHVLNGRTPSAYIAILLIRFFKERQYEDFNRTVKDHVEYITSGGEIEELERFVGTHPLMLRIMRVRMTDWVVTGEPQTIDVHLRSPIQNVDEAEIDKIDEHTGLDIFNQRLFEFNEWLSTLGEVPTSLQLKNGQRIEIRYQPDWLRYADEDGYDAMSDLSGTVDISSGIRLLIYCELGAKSSHVSSGLEIFFELTELFCGTEAHPAPDELLFNVYWPRVVSGDADVAEIFFSCIDKFPLEVRVPLEAFFKSFASAHREWVEKALIDSKVRDVESDNYIPRPGDVFHYNRVKEVFFKELKPILETCWTPYAQTCLEILEIERARAREHFDRMKKMKHLLD